jgi:hypothetical protein
MDDSGDKKKQDEGREPDFYFENGLMVFTASYHLKRGYCCKNGCRHCPYGFKKQNDDKLERR